MDRAGPGIFFPDLLCDWLIAASRVYGELLSMPFTAGRTHPKYARKLLILANGHWCFFGDGKWCPRPGKN